MSLNFVFTTEDKNLFSFHLREVMAELDEYDPLDLSKKGSFFILAGLPGSGKSHMMKFLIWNWWRKGIFDYYYGFVGPTSSDDLKSFLPTMHAMITKDTLLKFLRVAKRVSERGKRGLLIFDDISGFRKIFDDKDVKPLFSNFRHLRLTVLFCTQKITQVTTDIRENALVWIILNQGKSKAKRKYLRDEVCIDDEKEFDKFLDIVGDRGKNKYTALIVDKDKGKYTFTRAPIDVPQFVIG